MKQIVTVEEVKRILDRGYTLDRLRTMAIMSAEDGKITYPECENFIKILNQITDVEPPFHFELEFCR